MNGHSFALQSFPGFVKARQSPHAVHQHPHVHTPPVSGQKRIGKCFAVYPPLKNIGAQKHFMPGRSDSLQHTWISLVAVEQRGEVIATEATERAGLALAHTHDFARIGSKQGGGHATAAQEPARLQRLHPALGRVAHQFSGPTVHPIDAENEISHAAQQRQRQDGGNPAEGGLRLAGAQQRVQHGDESQSVTGRQNQRKNPLPGHADLADVFFFLTSRSFGNKSGFGPLP